MSARPDLTTEEINDICKGLMQNAAKCRYLRRLGLRVERRPNGEPLVARAEWERHLVSQATTAAVAAGNGPRWKVAA